ncbi:MAG: hypothetical protein RSB52_08810 [Acidaminococcaceae bacterium]
MISVWGPLHIPPLELLLRGRFFIAVIAALLPLTARAKAIVPQGCGSGYCRYCRKTTGTIKKEQLGIYIGAHAHLRTTHEGIIGTTAITARRQ